MRFGNCKRVGQEYFYYYRGDNICGNPAAHGQHEQVPEIYFFSDHHGHNIVPVGNFNGIRTYPDLYINNEVLKVSTEKF